jgi:hypothetical protein
MVIIQYDAMLRAKGVVVHGVNPGRTYCSPLALASSRMCCIWLAHLG